MKIKEKSIPAGFSAYLNIVRFFAAVIVVFYHTWSIVFPKFPLPWPGHAAVVVFFVLSGYVISYAASRPNLTGKIYIAHRAARILPVAIAALLLCIAIEPLVSSSNFHYSGVLHPVHFWRDTLINGFFLGQGWVDIAAPLNAPFWSLNFEVWYYVIFGTWVFSPKRFRLIAVVIVSIIAGPKALLMFPVWLTGVALHKWMPEFNRKHALMIFITTTASSLIFIYLDISIHIRGMMYEIFPLAMKYPGAANQFVGDFILGLLIALNFSAAYSLEDYFSKIPCKKIIKTIADFTFSTYLFHMPLCIFIWDVVGIRGSGWFYLSLIVGIFLLAEFTERRVAQYRKLFSEHRREIPA